MQLKLTEKCNKFLEKGAIDELKQAVTPCFRHLNNRNVFRSAIMLSCHNVNHLLKIPSLDAECIMLNLEDGVSIEQKPLALVMCGWVLSQLPLCSKKLVVRVNALNEGGKEEIAYLNAFMPDAIRIPKVRSISDVQTALDLIDSRIEVHLSIETKEAWAALSSLRVDERVKVFYLGILDLLADLDLPHSLIHPDNPMIHYILSHFLITSKAVGVKPISFVYQNHKNEDGLRDWLELEKALGYTSKGCLSPNQVTLIHSVFAHNRDEIERANEIIKLFEEAQARGITGFVHERYGFIDEPIYKGALSVLRHANIN